MSDAILRTPIVALLTVLVVTGDAVCQDEPYLKRGSHIEVVSAQLPDGIGVGWLVSLTADTLTFISDAGEAALPLDSIGQLRVNIGRDGAALNAAMLFGALLGAATAPHFSPNSDNCRLGIHGGADCGSEVRDELVGVLLGGGIGRLLARAMLDERWVNVRMDRLLYVVADSVPR